MPYWKGIDASTSGVKALLVDEKRQAVGSGAWPDVDAACGQAIQITAGSDPQPEAVAHYEHGYGLYRQLYLALRDLSPELGA